MKRLVLGSVIALFATTAFAANGIYWPSEKLGANILMNAGYHDIVILYRQPFACEDGQYDFNRVYFEAISKQNHIVKGHVCGGKIIPELTTETEKGKYQYQYSPFATYIPA